MNITIIRAAMVAGRGRDAMKPLVFSILAALSPENCHLTFLDDRVEPLPEQIDSQIIAISADTFSAKRAYALAKRYKRPDNTVVMGGFHPTVCPEEALEYADVVLRGDGEDTWPDFLADAEKGTLRRVYDGMAGPHRPMAAAFGAAAFGYAAASGHHPEKPYQGKGYLPLGILQFSRGCKFCCDFCSIKTMYPESVRQKPLEVLIREIQSMKEKLLFFADDNLFLDEGSARALFLALKPLKKKWACQISMDVAGNDGLLSLMRESGCVLVLMGFESLNRENLSQMNKAANLGAGDYDEAIQNIYRHGLLLYGTFVLGYDGDCREDVQRTMDFAMSHHMATANFNPLIPMPGTALYKRLNDQGRLLFQGRWWLAEDYSYGDTAYMPAQMMPEELRDACRLARCRFYSIRGIWKRLWGLSLHWRPDSFFLFMALNLVSAVEIRRKQGKRLGGTLHEADTD